jgi:diaminopropionate ammonia-lyase
VRVVAGESGAAGLGVFIELMTTKKMLAVKETLGITPETKILFYNTEGATDLENFNKIISQSR